MFTRGVRPALTVARVARQQQAGMATLKEIDQRCVVARPWPPDKPLNRPSSHPGTRRAGQHVAEEGCIDGRGFGATH